MIAQVMHLLGHLGQMLADLDPGAEVSIGLNGPPFFSLSGLRSQMSMWLGPPAIQSTMQLVGSCGPGRHWPSATRRTGSPGRPAPSRPGGRNGGGSSDEVGRDESDWEWLLQRNRSTSDGLVGATMAVCR